MKTAAEKLDSKFVTETVEAEWVVFKAIMLDEVNKYKKIVWLEWGTVATYLVAEV